MGTIRPVPMLRALRQDNMYQRKQEPGSGDELATLRESEKLYRSLVELANDGVVVLQDYLIRFVNRKFVEISGFSEEELLETVFTDHLVPQEIPILLDRYRKRVAGEPVPPVYETAITRKDGTTLPFEVSAAVIPYNGRPADLVWVRDITKRREAEETARAALQDARREERRSAVLESIAEMGLSTPRLQDLLDRVVERIAEVLSVDSSCVFVLDEQAREFVAHAAYNVPGLLGCRVRANEGLMGKIASERAPVYIPDVGSDPDAYDTCEVRTLAKTILGVPLIARGHVVGVTRVQSLARREFSDDEVRLLQSVADRVAIAIDNAMLYDELERSREDIRQALENEKYFSRLLQTALLPARPVICDRYSVAVGYVPVYVSRQVGGDFYDVFIGDQGWAAAVIGDVSGKGLEAASLAAATRSTVHAFTHESSSPSEVLTRANSVLYGEQSVAESFVTVSLLSLSQDSGELRYASAGHPPPIIMRADGALEFLMVTDLPLAVTEDYRYSEKSDLLSPGDKLVLYTDGISEARAGGGMFDLEGIERTLADHGDWSPQEVVDNLVSAATEWAQGKLRDDAAVVVIERISA